MRLLQSSWMVALIGGLLFLGTIVLVLDPSKFEGVQVAAKEILRSPNNDPSWKFRNPEFEQWVEQLKQEREALALKEQQLKELQTRIDAERAEISAVTQAVTQLQIEFDKNVVRFKQQEGENLKKQTKVIAAMSPEGAAKMLGELEDDEIVRILFTMKTDEAGAIVDAMSKAGKPEAKRAAVITERIRQAMPAAPSVKRPS